MLSLKSNAGNTMDEPLSKLHVLSDLRSARRDWEQLLLDVDAGQMTPAYIDGDWSVKGAIYHATRYADLFVQALDADLRGEPLPLGVLARPDIDERNAEHFRQSEQRTLNEVLGDSRTVFDRLLELVQLHSEIFWSELQRFEGVREPILVGKSLLHVGSHYRTHMATIRAHEESDSAKR